MKDNICIVYYYGDWGALGGRQNCIMKAVARYYPVFFLEDCEDNRWRITSNSPSPGVTAIRGLVAICNRLERFGFGWLSKLLGWWFVKGLRKKYSTIIFWNSKTGKCPYRFIPHDKLIYDCIDPPFCAGSKDAFLRQESELIKRSDMVFATAETLFKRCKSENSNTYLLNNACELSVYTKEKIALAKKPKWWPSRGRPIAAYLGTLDWRFDCDVIREAVVSNPEVDFVIAGRVNKEMVDGVRRIKEFDNVVFPGMLSLEEGCYLISRCSVGLIPFTKCEMNDAINPVKFYMYMLMGKPVVSTAIHELKIREKMNQVFCGETSQDFAGAIAVAIENGRDQSLIYEAREFAMENTWECRAVEAQKHINAMLECND